MKTKLTFTTTPAWNMADGFGCASLGLAGVCDNNTKIISEYPQKLNGITLTGSYAEVLARVENVIDPVYAAIVLFGNAGGENEFIRALSKKVKAPLVGGSAAINPVTGQSGLITGKGEAAIFLINDDRYYVEVVSKNIHRNILSKHTISYSDRWIDKIDGCEPKQWLFEKKEKLGLLEDDFEHLTLSDEHSINVHLSEVDNRIFSGRDLNENMYLRYISPNEVQTEIQEFYDDKDAIVFGCAGLKSILDFGLHTEGIGLFMFGEVCTVEGHSDFGNLMLSKLRIIKK